MAVLLTPTAAVPSASITTELIPPFWLSLSLFDSHSLPPAGLSARARSVFRIVTALAPPFVMESELDEDGLCLRGLPCHRLSVKGNMNNNFRGICHSFLFIYIWRYFSFLSFLLFGILFVAFLCLDAAAAAAATRRRWRRIFCHQSFVNYQAGTIWH